MHPLDELRLEIERAEPTRKVVFGDGSASARLVILGEAPGAEEERTGHPFAGHAGRMLDQLMAEAGIARSEVWITNVVKHRPKLARPGSRATRSPTWQEARFYTPWLRRELRIIHPAVVLCLGNVAADAVIHGGFQMASEHGRWFVLPDDDALALATYHPSYLRRFGRDLIQLAQEDFQKVRHALELGKA